MINAVLESLNIKDIGRLDSSNTNLKLRQSFLKRMGQFKSALFITLKPKSKEMLQWLIKRDICNVNEMIFSDSNIPQDDWFLGMMMPNLKIVRIKFDYSNQIDNITDVSLNHIGNGCPGLTTIDLKNCNETTDAGVIFLLYNCLELQDLSLTCDYAPTKITDSSLVAIGKKCPKLHSLSVMNCQMITDEGLKGLCKGCPDLKTLNISNCNKITDAGVIALVDKCPKLQDLDLARDYQGDMTKITDKSLVAIGKKCPKLHSLSLWKCKLITDEGLKGLCQGCPDLKTLNFTYLR